MANLSKTYQPKEFEKKIYEMWEEGEYFKPQRGKKGEAFSIVLPPPNITGQLHMGHALDHTLQDILIRYKRMQGYDTLWQPGTDHASIATEVKVVGKNEGGNWQRGIFETRLGMEGRVWRSYCGTNENAR